MKDFGSRLLQYRRQSGMSQEELSDKLDISRQTLSKWETGQSYPDAEKMMAVCSILSVTPNELLNCNTENKRTTEQQKSNAHDWVFDLFWVVMFVCGYGLFVAPSFALATPANWVVIMGMVMMLMPTIMFSVKGLTRLIRNWKAKK